MRTVLEFVGLLFVGKGGTFPLNFAFVVAKYLVKSQLVLSFKYSLCPKVFDKHLFPITENLLAAIVLHSSW